MTRTRGLFVVLDGPDGCGKSTQAQMLVERLIDRGRVVHHLREPGGTALGECIRTLLLEGVPDPGTARGEPETRRHDAIAPPAELLLFFASRAQLAEERIRPALAEGHVVVCERFVSSTFAYQSVASSQGVTATLALADLFLKDLFPPDLTLLFDIEAGHALERASRRAMPDRIETRGTSYHDEVRRGFLDYLALYPAVTRRIDVSAKGPQRVHEEVWEYVAASLAGETA
ncbi:MAG: dTMP kinase [Planctomycetes bacterium]|nr:dTMP kinase [Planctomycetota bacterium]